MMTSTRVSILAAALVSLMSMSGGAALAHGSTSVAITQLTPHPGEQVTVKGKGFEPSTLVTIKLSGSGNSLELGQVTTDDTGDFSTGLTLPGNLAAGTYELAANGGDENPTTQITVVGGATSVMSAETAPTLRERPLEQTIALVAVFGGIAALGLAFALWDRRRRAVA